MQYHTRGYGPPVVPWKAYLIPLMVLVTAIVIAGAVLQNFERAVEFMAPALLATCALLVVAGAVYSSGAMMRERHRARRYAEITAIVDNLATGQVTEATAWVGDSWRAVAILRAETTRLSSDELASVRAGLRTMGDGKRVAARSVGSRRKWERVRAIRDVAWLDDDDALPILCKAIADKDNDIAWAAVAALGHLSSPVADQVLLELLDDGRFAPSRIAELLDARPHHRDDLVLADRARASTDASLFWIAYLLGRSSPSSALGPLLDLSHHPSPNVRAAAAEGIGRLKTEDGVATLLRMVTDDVWYVRLHASRSLGDIAAKSGVPALLVAAEDPNWWVRRSALDSLHRMREVA